MSLADNFRRIMAVNVKFLNPFIDAATEVLMAEASVAVTRGSLSLLKTSLTTNEITVLINLVGQIQGVVLFSMAAETGIALVSRMLGQPFEELDPLAQSGVAELGNVISGRATIKLSEAGYQTTISPPTLITGAGVQISTLDFQQILVPLDTGMGQIIVHLALRELPAGQWNASNFVPLIASATNPSHS